MKRTYLILFLILVVLLSATVFAAEESVYLWDEADILNSAEETSLNTELARISQDIGMDIAVATVTDEDTYSLSYHADMLYAQKGYGSDGVILLLSFSPDGRNYYIAGQGAAQNILEDGGYSKVENACLPHLRDGDYSTAISTYAQKCQKLISSHGKISLGGILLCIVIGALLSFLIPMNILKGQLKTVRRQPEAASYIQKDSFEVKASRDNFLYRNVSRVPRPKNNSSSSRGGSSGGHSGRGGSF